MEHRNYQRIALDNYCVDAADGRGFFQGAVSDISRFGVCLMGFSTKINVGAKKMTIVKGVARTHDKPFKISCLKRIKPL